MKKATFLVLAAAMLQSNMAMAISDSEAFAESFGPTLISSAVPSAPTLLLNTSAQAVDRKMLIERIANDALLNIETGEKSVLLGAIIADLKSKHPELANLDDKEISKKLVKEAINQNVNESK